jgi:hypothetical protein
MPKRSPDGIPRVVIRDENGYARVLVRLSGRMAELWDKADRKRRDKARIALEQVLMAGKTDLRALQKGEHVKPLTTHELYAGLGLLRFARDPTEDVLSNASNIDLLRMLIKRALSMAEAPDMALVGETLKLAEKELGDDHEITLRLTEALDQSESFERAIAQARSLALELRLHIETEVKRLSAAHNAMAQADANRLVAVLLKMVDAEVMDPHVKERIGLGIAGFYNRPVALPVTTESSEDSSPDGS